MYENAVRALTASPKFAMPYWDWTVDRTMPAVFTDPAYKGKPNALYVGTRTLTDPARWPLRDAIVGPGVMQAIYGETAFQLFGTSKNPNQNDLDMSWVVRGGGSQAVLERTPHNSVHNFIDGFMPSPGSPRDPPCTWTTQDWRGRSRPSVPSSSDANLPPGHVRATPLKATPPAAANRRFAAGPVRSCTATSSRSWARR